METIKKNEEFQNMYSKGKKYFGYYFLLYIKKNHNLNSKFGVVVSKKTGNAVCRVRLKRLFREIYRKEEEKLDMSYDYVFIAKRSAGEVWKTLKCQELERDVVKVLKKAGVYK